MLPVAIRLVLAALVTVSNMATAAVFEDQGDRVVLKNDHVRVVIRKDDARVLSLRKDNVQLIGNGGGGYHQRIAYDHGDPPRHAHDAFSMPEGCVFRLVRDEGSLIEVSFVEEPSARFPFRFDSRFAMRDGESGFHNYVILHYFPNLAARACLQQLNFVLRADPEWFRIEQAGDDLWRVMPVSAELRRDRLVMDATYRLGEDSDYRRRYGRDFYTKYDLVVSHERHRVHGTCSSGRGFGIWFIQPSGEYLNGGPLKQELSVHQTGTTPIVLGVYHDTHFGSERLFFDAAKDSPWKKTYGPQFIYVNRGTDREEMWNDAVAEAEELYEEWPYSWMTEPDYHAQGRVTVRGRLQIDQEEKDLRAVAAADALVILSAPESGAGVHWQEQGRDRMFWTRADGEGRFELPHVTPGRYALSALVDGVFEEFVHGEIDCVAGENRDLGTILWRPRRHGRTAWQIGVPDRDSAEFRRGDNARHWGGLMRDRYRREFPEGVDFDVRTDKTSTDWNYVHPHLDERSDTWTIRFPLARVPVDDATLRLGIAGSRYAGLELLLAEEVFANLDLTRGRKYAGQGYPRSATRGFFEERTVPVPSSLLREGQNVLKLRLVPAGKRDDPYRSVHYDCLRLEIPEPEAPDAPEDNLSTHAYAP